MKTTRFITLVAVVVAAAAVTVLAQPTATRPSQTKVKTLLSASAQSGATNDELLKFMSELTKMTRVTENRFPMNPGAAAACAFTPATSIAAPHAPPPPPIAPINHAQLLPDGGAVIQVYVTSDGVAAMKDPKRSFPVGAVILKQKFTSMEAKSPALYTGMVKREKGFNPECGDWEFFTVNGDGTAITSRGRIDSCMDCHKAFPDSDFVTRLYPMKFDDSAVKKP